MFSAALMNADFSLMSKKCYFRTCLIFFSIFNMYCWFRIGELCRFSSCEIFSFKTNLDNSIPTFCRLFFSWLELWIGFSLPSNESRITFLHLSGFYVTLLSSECFYVLLLSSCRYLVDLCNFQGMSGTEWQENDLLHLQREIFVLWPLVVSSQHQSSPGCERSSPHLVFCGRPGRPCSDLLNLMLLISACCWFNCFTI